MKSRNLIILFAIFGLLLAACEYTEQNEPTPEQTYYSIWIDAPLDGSNIPLEPYKFVFHGMVMPPNEYEVRINGIVAGTVAPTGKTETGQSGFFTYGEFLWTPPAHGQYIISVLNTGNNFGPTSEATVNVIPQIANPAIEVLPTENTFGMPTPTPGIPETATPAEGADCDVAAFITDVTVPDGTVFAYGEAFTKTWRLQNIGTCPWTRAYELVFFSGDQMSGPDSQAFIPEGTVEPNQTVDVSIDLIAPREDGNYMGNWKLKNADGQEFGLSNGNPFYVDIGVAKVSGGIVSPSTDPDVTLLIPDFSIEYAGSWFCVAQSAFFRIENTGNVIFETLHIKVEGPPGTHINGVGPSIYPFRDPPPPSSDCWKPGNQFLDPGGIAWVHLTASSIARGVETGRVIINICSGPNLSGLCVEKTLDFDW